VAKSKMGPLAWDVTYCCCMWAGLEKAGLWARNVGFGVDLDPGSYLRAVSNFASAYTHFDAGPVALM